jgi:hypothetical protein
MRTVLFIGMMFCQTTHALGQNEGGMSANNLAGTTWYINGVLGFHESTEKHVLRAYHDGMLSYGYFVSFHDNGATYDSRYEAPCGMDCFTTVKGQYEVRGHDLLRISAHHVRIVGPMCPEWVDEQRPPNSALFQMTFQSDTLLLTKVQ